MMIEVVSNKLDGLYARPKHHPVTCANPSPWKIIQVKIEANPLKLWIRGKDSMWFRADQCDIGLLEDLKAVGEMAALPLGYYDNNGTEENLTIEERLSVVRNSHV